MSQREQCQNVEEAQQLQQQKQRDRTKGDRL